MLQVAEDLALPPEAVTAPIAILAQRGSGKTYTAAVMVEEMVKAGLPVAVIDPIGVWWGLRSDAAGTGPGLPVVVFGGDHGDLPLDADAGEAIAEVIIDLRPPAVIDLSLLRKGEQQRFVTAFAERLYHRNRAPLHLVLDEADAWAPQRPLPGQQRLLGAVEDLVRRGRARGIGVTLITQRPAVLHKDVLTQIQVLICLRMVAPHDREAIDAWVRAHGTPEQRDELMASLPSLPVGTAWFWSPGWLNLFRRVAIRQRETFDSSATPKLGEQRVTPRALAPVDLEGLRAAIAATLERVEADDPQALRRRIAALERALRDRPAPERIVERVEVPVIGDDVAATITLALGSIVSGVERIQGVLLESARRRGTLAGTIAELSVDPSSPPTAPMPIPLRPVVVAVAPQQHVAARGGGEHLAAGQRRMLDVLARRHPGRLTAPQLGALAGLSHKGGTFTKYVSVLREQGLIDVDGDVGITAAGFAAIDAQPPAAPQSPAEALAMWRARLPGGTVRVLDALVAAYPAAVDRVDLACQAGLTEGGGAFSAAVGNLRRYALAEADGRSLRASSVVVAVQGGVP